MIEKKKLWVPREPKNTNLYSFSKKYIGKFSDYEQIHKFSIDHSGEFWSGVWDFCHVIGEKGEIPLKSSPKIHQSKFFPQGTLNYAENLLQDAPEKAIVYWDEASKPKIIEKDELFQKSVAFGQWLKSKGIRKGDRVCVVLPNTPEAIFIMLGTVSIGAIFSAVSPDFGKNAILDRFSQIEPKVLVSCDGYKYKSKLIDCRDKVLSLLKSLPSVDHHVFCSKEGLEQKGDSDITQIEDIYEAYNHKAITFEKFPFNHPVYILFSSGTTGRPKCIVHGAGGTLLQHKKEHQLQLDLKPNGKMFYFTTTGWMMWNWLVGGLASSQTIYLFHGSPFYPSANIILDVIASEKINLFGVSAKYIQELSRLKIDIKEIFDLSDLSTITTTGSPLSPESFDFIYRTIKTNVHLASICGGTDIVSCFVGASPIDPVFKGEIQKAGLGMDVDVYDDNGRTLINCPGELVCKNSFPSMPIGFWNDENHKKYLSSYFSKYKNVWHQGDFAVKTKNNGYVVQGRSDTTLNPGGVRIGTSEIYRQIETISEIKAAVVAERIKSQDVEVILFVVLMNGCKLDENLQQEIKSRLREQASPRHVPDKIIACPDIPYTKSGKISELAVKNALNNIRAENLSALENPESLDFFFQFSNASN
mgnify:CR=1 FL=1